MINLNELMQNHQQLVERPGSVSREESNEQRDSERFDLLKKLDQMTRAIDSYKDFKST